MKFNTKTIRGFLLSQLTSGKSVTTSSVAKKFKTSVECVSARISELRSDGYAIYGNSTKTKGRGASAQSFRLGKPSRAMVAAAYASQGSAVFG